MRKKNWNSHERIGVIVVGFIITVTLLLIAASWYLKRYEAKNAQASYRTYKYHYMLIESEPDSSFFKSLHEGAQDAGKKHDIYVEDLAASVEKNYSIEELMEIAIAANPDGIIVEADASKQLQELIDRASEHNIPVVTTYGDSKESKRKSFVGINEHQLGEIYGTQVLKQKQAGVPLKVTTLMETGEEGEVPNLIYSGMKEVLGGEDIELDIIRADRGDTFSSEEQIRSLVLSGESRPDVLVCMNEVDTICAYQAVVDYNAVGKMNIIGSYASPQILKAIQKGVITSSITIDAKEMGTKVVEALIEYQKSKFISEYETVEPQVITKENVDHYIKEIKKDE